MFLVIRKPWLWGAGLFCCFFLGLAAVLWSGHQTPVAAFSTQKEGPITVVVDPGHGGEDGGASSADGALESHINLAVATRLYLSLIHIYKGCFPIIRKSLLEGEQDENSLFRRLQYLRI